MPEKNNLSLSVQYPDPRLKDILTRPLLRRWVKAALLGPAELTLRFVDQEEGRSLNRDYRGKDYATNVLTFCYDDDEFGDDEFGDDEFDAEFDNGEPQGPAEPLAGELANAPDDAAANVVTDEFSSEIASEFANEDGNELASPADTGTAIEAAVIAAEEAADAAADEAADADEMPDVANLADAKPDHEDAIIRADIILCSEVLESEAQAQNKTLLDHAAHLIVHGVLHAQGYDHEDELEAEAMEQLETAILARLGIANPYAERS